MNAENLIVLTNIIGAVESGGQIYGRRNYAAYTGPRAAIPGEKTITLGWAQNYGYEARRLVKKILESDPETFRSLDTCKPSVETMLKVDWVAAHWIPDEATRDVLIALIDSESGHKAQDGLFTELMDTFIADCSELYTDDIRAQMMYCEIRHLGGKNVVKRIFDRCEGDYTLNNIMGSLAKDQIDRTNDNQVGDSIYWSRHVKCKEFIEKYAVDETEPEEVATMTPKERAKILLRQQYLSVMTGYTPEGAQCFKDAGAWTKTPSVGYPVYFYGKPSGESRRICHVGIVEWVDPKTKKFGTVEGNSSSSEWTTNGGVVARHTYSYENVGGTNRVNGFGAPDFEGAGVTPEAFVAVAVSYIGYEEKRSNANLDDFHANAGSNNYQKFERDVIGYTGNQWCQYFVDACAIYVCEGKAVDITGGNNDLKIRTLSKGATGSDVKTVQILLIHKFGISCGKSGADGDFGDNTDYAVRKFQTIKGLEVDGYVGPLTWAALVA